MTHNKMKIEGQKLLWLHTHAIIYSRTKNMHWLISEYSELRYCQCHHDHDLCVAKSLLKYVKSNLSEHTGGWWKQNWEVESMRPITISKTEGKKLLWLDTPEITHSCTSTTNMQGLISKYFEFRHCQCHHDHDLCVAQSLLMLNHTF